MPVDMLSVAEKWVDMPRVAEKSVEIVKIEKVENGFIVAVGCKKFVAKDWEELSTGLREYWDNPVEARRKYCKD